MKIPTEDYMEDIRSKLIDATYKEVFANGYGATSLSNILKASDCTKGSMYHYFKSKKELILAMIEEKIAKKTQEFWQDLESTETNIIEFLIYMFKDTSKRDFAKGCALGNILQESLINDEDFATLVKNIFAQWQELFRKTLEKAKFNNEIKNIDTQNVSLFLIASFEGALLLSKQSQSSKEYDICIEQLIIYLDSLKNN